MASAFERLHKTVQHVLWDMKWTQLHKFQADTIHTWFDTSSDILIMANTAGGKTEAAFLPILSQIAPDNASGSIRALYVSPLKALINDQFRRLEELCNRSEIPVHRWHGDVGAAAKASLLKKPSGVLLITPESLESLLMKHARHVPFLFRTLDAIVIDELHVFLNNERGTQLRCQLARLNDLRNGLSTSRRVGLSATIGDVKSATQWLSGISFNDTSVIESKKASDIELLLKSFVTDESKLVQDSIDDSSNFQIVDHILANFLNKTNLIFCNRKSLIEELADALARICEKRHTPNQFIVHHGSLSKDIREDAEAALKSSRSCTAICSSTLELGIDIGNVDTVGQIGPPSSVSSLKQRLGRSGRRDKPGRLFMYIPLLKPKDSLKMPDALYPDLIQAIALIELMVGSENESKWIEPPDANVSDFSTLIQQIMAIIFERGGINAAKLYELTCSTDTFGRVSTGLFMEVLRDLGKSEVIEQTSNGDLILGLKGEQITSHYSFFAAFATPVSYEVYSPKSHVGSVDGTFGYYQPDQYMLLAGKRWRIIDVDEAAKKIMVEMSHGKQLVRWHGDQGAVHHRIRERMFNILNGTITPAWLESTSTAALAEARATFKNLCLGQKRIIAVGKDLFFFTWTGTRVHNTIHLILKSQGLQSINYNICFQFGDGITGENIAIALRDFLRNPKDAITLVNSACGDTIPPVGKHGHLLSETLKARAYAAKYLDIDGTLIFLDTFQSLAFEKDSF